MRKQNRSCGVLATAKSRYHFGTNKIIKSNKRGYSAEGYSLLTSALRPRLFGIGISLGLAAVISITLNAGNNQVSAVSATLSVPEGISVNANPSVNNGFAESSNGAISVSTGNQMGYTLTIKAKDNNQLKNGSNVLNSISTNLTTDQYKNGDYVNTWGFKPSAINSASNTSYVPGPTTSGIILAKTNANSTTAENYSLGIAAKVDSSTVAGNYTNTFTISATANEATYTINYDLNGGSGGPSKTTETGDIGSKTFVNVTSSVPTYSGKDFLGWCSVNPGTDDICNGVLVQPNGQFPLCKCNLNITLYAMYGKKMTDPNKNNGESCTVGNISGTKYAGYCWSNTNKSESATWYTATSSCNGSWHLPTLPEFVALLQAIGNENQLYDAGWSGYYWSSDYVKNTNLTNDAYALVVTTDHASITTSPKVYSYGSMSTYNKVRCVANQ